MGVVAGCARARARMARLCRGARGCVGRGYGRGVGGGGGDDGGGGGADVGGGEGEAGGSIVCW